MNEFSYLLQVNIYLIVFYVFYWGLLRNETFFKLNRFYLLGSALLSICIPLLKTDWIKELFVTGKVQMFTESITYTMGNSAIPHAFTLSEIRGSQPILKLGEALWLIYGLISLFLFMNFIRKLYLVNKLLKHKVKGQAFSFFGRIAVDENLDGKDAIMSHELVHARQWHSADVVLFEILLALNWFNPIIYLYRKAIKNSHEFIADDSAASTLEDRSAYALLLVSNVFNTQPQHLTNNFFNQSLLKRRIIMLHKRKSRKVAILKYGLSVPLFAGMMICSSAIEVEAQVKEVLSKSLSSSHGIMKVNVLRNAEILNNKGEIEPAVALEVKSKKNGKVPTNQLEPGLIELPVNLADYANNFKDRSNTFSEGLLFISFEVDDNNKPGSFKITKSDYFQWEDDYLKYLNSFNETVTLEKGIYHFYKGYMYSGNEDKFPSEEEIFKGSTKMLFGGYTKRLPEFITLDETKGEAGKIVNYISKAPLTDPVIIIDGKEATYKKVKMGFKLDETIYPKMPKTIQLFKGDKAVAEYNETARNGLIVIVTQEPGTSDK